MVSLLSAAVLIRERLLPLRLSEVSQPLRARAAFAGSLGKDRGDVDAVHQSRHRDGPTVGVQPCTSRAKSGCLTPRRPEPARSPWRRRCSVARRPRQPPSAGCV